MESGGRQEGLGIHPPTHNSPPHAALPSNQPSPSPSSHKHHSLHQGWKGKVPPLPGCILGLLVLQDDPIYSQSQILEQSRSTFPTSQLPLLFVVGSKRRLCYNGGCHQFGFAISPPWTPSPSFRVGHHPSALLQTCPISAFKVPGVFLEPLELSHGHCGGFTAQDALLANGDPCVLGFGDIGGVCKGM